MSDSEKIASAIESLAGRIRKRLGLPESIAIGGIPVRDGVSTWAGKGQDPGHGGGINPPLTETGRTHHDAVPLQSVDGIFTIVFMSPNVITMEDGDGNEVPHIYQDQYAE